MERPAAGLIVCLVFASFMLQCVRDMKDSADTSSNQARVFVPPPDSTIAPQQMTAWFNCNSALDSLSEIFIKSISSGKSVTITDSVQKNLLREQNRICFRNGLKGGFEEYRWILVHLGDFKNKPLYDSIKIRSSSK
jgi:hypothetical protein